MRKKVNSYCIRTPKDEYILREVSTSCAVGNVLKPMRCKTKGAAAQELVEIQDTLSDRGLIMSFEDGTTLDVVTCHGIHDRGKQHHNSLRYYLILECNYGDGAFIADVVIDRLAI